MLRSTKMYLDRKSDGLHLYTLMDIATESGWNYLGSVVPSAENGEPKVLVDLGSSTQLRRIRDDAY